MNTVILILLVVSLVVAALGVRIVRPTERGLIETLGKYSRYSDPGFHWIVPAVQSMVKVEITEQMVDAGKREVITKDNLNTIVDAQIYFKVKDDEESVKRSEYVASAYQDMIVSLTRTTLRNVIGTLTLRESNSERGRINSQLLETLHKEASNWGIDVVRAELKEIEPPKDVQAAMNMVVKAQNEKEAAVDFATAAETRADGERRSAIKAAEGMKQAQILQAEGSQQAQVLEAEGKAKAIQLVSEASDKYFKGNAVELKKLQVVSECLQNNAKIIMTKDGITPELLLGTFLSK